MDFKGGEYNWKSRFKAPLRMEQSFLFLPLGGVSVAIHLIKKKALEGEMDCEEGAN